jgi:hypothetical protein
MEMLLVYEVIDWEQLFWNKFEAFLDQIDRVEVKERLTREWRADCWKRLNRQMHAAEKRSPNFDRGYYILGFGTLGRLWALCIGHFLKYPLADAWLSESNRL